MDDRPYFRGCNPHHLDIGLDESHETDDGKPVSFRKRESSHSPHVDGMGDYLEKYKESIENPEKFWTDVARDFYWHDTTERMNRHQKPMFESNLDVRKGPIFTRFMPGAKTNLSYNALDRNIERGLGNKIAYYWEGNNIGDEGKVTYSQLLSNVSRFANALKEMGLKKGDRVAIYLPMILELPIAMLACARIGVIHSVVFGGFSADSLSERMIDGQCSVLVTADGVWRGNKFINLKEIADEACARCEAHGHPITRKFVVRHMGPVKSVSNQLANSSENGLTHHPKGLGGAGDQRRGSLCTKVRQDALVIAWDDSIDRWWHEELHRASDSCPVEWMDAEDPLFILYTSGSTGKPKGVLHTTAGYMVYAAFTFKCVFDYQEDDVYWCTADAGWITGHSYLVYGPLINGVTGIVFEGIPTHPEPDRYWKVIEKYRVTKFYTAPTVIRSLMKFGEDLVLNHDRSSLKILGTVGEPINPEAWLWYHKYVGNSQCAIVDTYWQ
ncbi:hypothetical protein RvY_10013-2 [Ramazzottius varieornatus]|nr:hypothetical protein RvY_10013-2 [Ramazzottius varieornatus]